MHRIPCETCSVGLGLDFAFVGCFWYLCVHLENRLNQASSVLVDFELNSEASGRHNGSLVSEMGRQMNMVFSAHFLVAWRYENARESQELAQCVE